MDYRIVKDPKYLVLVDGSLDGLTELYDGLIVKVPKKKKKLLKKEYKAFMEEFWDKYVEKFNYKLIIVIGSELFKFMTGVKKANNYQTEMYKFKEDYTLIQGIQYQGIWLEKNKYIYNIVKDTINRYFNNKEPVRIWEYIEPKKVKYYL